MVGWDYHNLVTKLIEYLLNKIKFQHIHFITSNIFLHTVNNHVHNKENPT